MYVNSDNEPSHVCYLAPRVHSIHIHRVNPVKFNVTVLVEYTGAGSSASLEFLHTEFKSLEGSMAGWHPLNPHIPLVRDANSIFLWKAEFMNQSFAALRRVEFRFSIRNKLAAGTYFHNLEGVSG